MFCPRLRFRTLLKTIGIDRMLSHRSQTITMGLNRDIWGICAIQNKLWRQKWYFGNNKKIYCTLHIFYYLLWIPCQLGRYSHVPTKSWLSLRIHCDYSKEILVGTILSCPNKYFVLLTCVANNILEMPRAAATTNFGWLVQATISGQHKARYTVKRRLRAERSARGFRSACLLFTVARCTARCYAQSW